MTRALLDEAMSPTEAVEKLAAKGVHISERALRRRAREIGACRVFGKAMLLLPEHLEILLEEPAPCRSESTTGTASAAPPLHHRCTTAFSVRPAPLSYGRG